MAAGVADHVWRVEEIVNLLNQPHRGGPNNQTTTPNPI